MKISPNYCLVTQRVIAITADSDSDEDRLPDQQTVSGEIYFTPNVPSGRAYQLKSEDGKHYTIPLGRVEASIVDGEIVHEGERGIHLFAAGQGSNPSKISYYVEYRNLRAGTTTINLSPMNFEAVPGGEVDLTTATPITGATPAGTTKGDKGDVGPAATIVSHEALPDGDVQVEFSDGTVITVPAGETPYVKDGNWWIGEQDTGVIADGVDQVRNALISQISTIESNAQRAETAASGTENAIARNSSKGQQLIVNGNGQLGSDYWSPVPRAVGEDAPLGAYTSWERPGGQAVIWHDKDVVIDPSLPTYMSGFFRQVNEGAAASVYLAVAPVDQDGLSISALNVMYVQGTLTKLARDINPGDTKVYLESAKNWTNTGTGEGNKRFIFWNHVSRGGKKWEPETYSRNVSKTAWEPGAINYDENTVTLKAPWSEGFVPKDTPLSNGDNGANYMYINMATVSTGEWQKIDGSVQGKLDTTGRGFSSVRGWPPGVSAIKPGVLINYGTNQRESNHRFANIYLSQLSPLGHTHTVSDISDIEVNGDKVTIAGVPVGEGPQGPQGEPGPLTFEDFTSEQLESLRGEPGEVTLEQLNQAIRVDTSAGTHVTAHGVTIFGDTGTRVLTSWDADGNVTYGTLPTGVAPTPDRSGGIYIRRVGQRVTMSFVCAIATSDAPSVPVPEGFRVTHVPYPQTNLNPVRSRGPVSVSVGALMLFLSGFTVGENIASTNESYSSNVIWDCTQDWPTSLPGRPA